MRYSIRQSIKNMCTLRRNLRVLYLTGATIPIRPICIVDTPILVDAVHFSHIRQNLYYAQIRPRSVGCSLEG